MNRPRPLPLLILLAIALCAAAPARAQCFGGSCAAPSYTVRSGNPFDNGPRIEVVVPGYTGVSPVPQRFVVQPFSGAAPVTYYYAAPQAYTAPRPRTAYFPGGEYRTFGAPARRGFLRGGLFRGGLFGGGGGCLGGCH